jgi:UDP-N-acetylmuramoylalanine--D-glutamate ligase
MRDINKIKQFKKIGVMGIARSGIAVAQKAKALGLEVFLSDVKNLDIDLKEYNIELGGHTEKLLEMDLLIVSPGIPLTIPILQKAKEKQIPMWSEIEFGYHLTHPDTKIIAVTGSNGKSTTVNIIYHVLKENGFDVILAGNVGEAYSGFPIEQKHDFIVLEVSSFQLDLIHDFQPDIALILNITPDHLDRYPTLQDYALSKFNIFKNMGDEGVKILNDSDLVTAEVLRVHSNGKYTYFNATNANAAYTALSSIISQDQFDRAYKSFKPLEHRLELVTEHNGVKYINDSKATNTDSVKYALNTINEPIHLILGGYHKGEDYSVLIDTMKEKVKKLYLIGNTTEMMLNTFYKDFDIETHTAFESVIRSTIKNAKSGEVVLLSPACASFDWFKNFEDRGKQFKEIVRKLLNISVSVIARSLLALLTKQSILCALLVFNSLIKRGNLW